jgi:hypothetical protein
VKDVNIMTSTTNLSFEICSYGDDLSIGISTICMNPDVVKNFCRIFSARGIEGRINGNKTHDRQPGARTAPHAKGAPDDATL